MKKRIKHKTIVGRWSVVFAICTTMIATSAITAVGATLKLDNQPLLSANIMSYSFDFEGPNLQATSANGASYTTLSMAGCIAKGEGAGDPAVPVRVVQLMLPPKKTVAHVNVIGTPVTMDVSSTNLATNPIFPEQKPVPIGSDTPQQFTVNSQVYSSDAYYPSTLYSNEQVGYSHGYAILSINLNPVQYNPEQGTVVYYPKLTVVITLQTDTTANALYRNDPTDEAYVKTLVSNPEVADSYSLAHLATARYVGGLCNTRDHYDYVIVTTTENGLDHWAIGGTLTYNWTSLMAKHAAEGLTSTLVTVQAINANPAYWNTSYYPRFNDTQAHIREFCKDAYSNWGTKYILFAGDADANALPPRLMDSGGETGVDADLYWSNLDNNFNANHDTHWGEEGDAGFDLYSEVAIGRIPCEHQQDVSNWLTKSFYYADSTDSTYLDNTAFYGGDTGWSCQGDDFMDYSAIKGTHTWLGPQPDPFPTWVPFQYGFETWNAVNPGNQYNLSQKWTEAPSPNPGWQPNGIVGLRNAINNDLVTIISGIAHADNQMSLDVGVSTWLSSYHNTKPFFLHDYGCHCGDFDAGDGVLDAMLYASNTKLAFGCVYNTGYGWGNLYCTNSSSAFQAKEFWGWFLDVANHSGDFSHWQLGVAQAWSKDQMAPMLAWDSGTWREIIQSCLLFADPAQLLKTPHPSDPPAQPTRPAGPQLGIWHVEYTYTSSTTDPNGDQILYLFDWGDGSNSGWLGPYTSGQMVLTKHTWTVLGNYSVVVRAKDVWGAASFPSQPLNVTITDNTPPLAPEITGPDHGDPGNPYLFNIQTTDPQEDNIWFFVDWGDNLTSGWLGPYVSGTLIHVQHTWTVKGVYNVKAKAKDTMGAESPWSNITMNMPLDLTFGITPSQQLLYTTLMGMRLNQNG
jgi:hypothetical protein